jgi:rhodanese-related sulfurtransferase
LCSNRCTNSPPSSQRTNDFSANLAKKISLPNFLGFFFFFFACWYTNISIKPIFVWMMKHIDYATLKKKAPDSYQLIDVREPQEHAAHNIGGLLIPLNELMAAHAQIATDVPVVIYCAKGIRSQIAIQRLEQKYEFKNLYNLRGGIAGLAPEIGV